MWQHEPLYAFELRRGPAFIVIASPKIRTAESTPCPVQRRRGDDSTRIAVNVVDDAADSVVIVVAAGVDGAKAVPLLPSAAPVPSIRLSPVPERRRPYCWPPHLDYIH